jgi:hypothetical protein
MYDPGMVKVRAEGTPIVRLDRDRLEGNNLGEFAPYEPESGVRKIWVSYMGGKKG